MQQDNVVQTIGVSTIGKLVSLPTFGPPDTEAPSAVTERVANPAAPKASDKPTPKGGISTRRKYHLPGLQILGGQTRKASYIGIQPCCISSGRLVKLSTSPTEGWYFHAPEIPPSGAGIDHRLIPEDGIAPGFVARLRRQLPLFFGR